MSNCFWYVVNCLCLPVIEGNLSTPAAGSIYIFKLASACMVGLSSRQYIQDIASNHQSLPTTHTMAGISTLSLLTSQTILSRNMQQRDGTCCLLSFGDIMGDVLVMTGIAIRNQHGIDDDGILSFALLLLGSFCKVMLAQAVTQHRDTSSRPNAGTPLVAAV